MKLRVVLACFLFLIPILALAETVSSPNYQIFEPTIAVPGGYSASGSYTVYGSAGEIAYGTSSSVSYFFRFGVFSFPVADPPVLSAEVGNISGVVNLSWSAAIPYLGYTLNGYDVGLATVSGGPYTYNSVGNVLTYDASSLSNGTPYYFIVRAFDDANIPIATSSEISATPVSPSLTFVVDSGSESLPALTPGSFVATSSILELKGLNPSGFAVTLVRANEEATLVHSVDPTVLISDKTDWTAPAATTTTSNTTASTTQPLTLQFRLWRAFTDAPNYASVWWGADDTTSGALFAGIPSTTQTIFNRSVPAAATTTARVLYGVNVPVTQKTGIYTGDVIYSATANP